VPKSRKVHLVVALAIICALVLAAFGGRSQGAHQKTNKVHTVHKQARRHMTPIQLSGDGERVARRALQIAGATSDEIRFAIPICRRETHCRLHAVNQNSRTGDDSWGPWQINYYGRLYAGRSRFIGVPSTNITSWPRAARNFVKFLRAAGKCNWDPPGYCS